MCAENDLTPPAAPLFRQEGGGYFYDLAGKQFPPGKRGRNVLFTVHNDRKTAPAGEAGHKRGEKQ